MIYDWETTGDDFVFWDGRFDWMDGELIRVRALIERIWNPDTMQETLAEHGFNVVAIREVESPKLWRRPFAWLAARHPRARALGDANPYYTSVGPARSKHGAEDWRDGVPPTFMVPTDGRA